VFQKPQGQVRQGRFEPATLENLCAFIRAQLHEALPGLSAVMVECRASGDRCVMRWKPTVTVRR